MKNVSRVSLYKEALALEEKKAVVQARLNEVQQRLAAIKSALFNDEGSKFGRHGKAAARSTAKGGKRAGRGELKAKILQALEAAGSAGARVTELAKSLGVKTANVHAWFQSAVKRIPNIKKIGAAHYRAESTSKPAQSAKPAKSAANTKRPAKAGKRKAKVAPSAPSVA